ncbi:MAG: hypothetical protein ACE5LH_09350 [Fidelibacterota bacterium]
MITIERDPEGTERGYLEEPADVKRLRVLEVGSGDGRFLTR